MAGLSRGIPLGSGEVRTSRGGGAAAGRASFTGRTPRVAWENLEALRTAQGIGLLDERVEFQMDSRGRFLSEWAGCLGELAGRRTLGVLPWRGGWDPY